MRIASGLCVLLGLTCASTALSGTSEDLAGPCSKKSFLKGLFDLKCLTLSELVAVPEEPEAMGILPGAPPPGITEELPPPETPSESPSPPDIGNSSIGDIVNIGDWVWKMVEGHKPVMDISVPDPASALPKDPKSWESMGPWQGPRAVRFRVVGKNLWRQTVVDVPYSLQFMYGARWHGKGRYLKNVIIVPGSEDDMSVAWAFHVEMTAKILAILNFGKPKDPIAGIQALVSTRAESMLSARFFESSYVMQGNGKFFRVDPESYRRPLAALAVRAEAR